MPMIGGRYRLIAEVGTGGTASVWRAVDVRLERTVAIKILLPELAGLSRARERAEAEARAAAGRGAQRRHGHAGQRRHCSHTMTASALTRS
ncbi:hypothetical protein [Dactylosporangium sp. NPDC006015]|uniref:hypothetical protein n=1 Tax=Dactylosporangium sp. NPDC006015 TaxID=3154576 RepID=UPI0033A70730